MASDSILMTFDFGLEKTSEMAFSFPRHPVIQTLACRHCRAGGQVQISPRATLCDQHRLVIGYSGFLFFLFLTPYSVKSSLDGSTFQPQQATNQSNK